MTGLGLGTEQGPSLPTQPAARRCGEPVADNWPHRLSWFFVCPLGFISLLAGVCGCLSRPVGFEWGDRSRLGIGLNEGFWVALVTAALGGDRPG